MKSENKAAYSEGLAAGIPIGLGYLAVAFSLGIAAKNAGLTPFQGFLASALCNASAGEYAGFTSISAGASYLETAIITLIANARYLLMSCSMSQRLSPELHVGHRAAAAFFLTDEFLGISMARPGVYNPFYTYGAITVASPCWAVGTALGAIAGNLLPVGLVSAFGVALYGMFLATIIPPAKKSRIIAVLIIICFAASYAASRLPFTSQLSEGTRIIILTVILSSAAAVLFPIKDDEEK